MALPLYVSAKSAPMSPVKAYPNPFSSASENLTIEKVDKTAWSGSVKLTVYDFNMKELFSRDYAAPVSIQWNGHDSLGRRLRPGVYFLRLRQEATDSTFSEKYIKVLIK